MHREIVGLRVATLVALAGCAGAVHEPTVEEVPLHIAAREPDLFPVEAVRREPEKRLQGLPLPPVPREHLRVGRLIGRGSLSIGTTRDGFLVGCRLLPLEGPHHKVLKEQAGRGTNCGTDEMVEALLRAAERVAKKYPGAILTIGNISRNGGGDIPWSISHNAGRDADIGFYLVGPDGQQFVPDTFVPLDASGKGEVNGVEVRLDVARTWWFVRSLLEDPRIQVQWIFVSNPVRALLLREAERLREPQRLIAMASEALAQPRRAKPHQDHLHVRIYCAVDDVYEGCQDRGTDRSWYKPPLRQIEARVKELKGLLGSKSAERRAAAMVVLARMGRPEALPALARGLWDKDWVVRSAAARAIREMGATGMENDVVHAVRSGIDIALVPTLLDALNRTLKGKRRVEVLGRLLNVHRKFEVDLGVFRLQRTVSEFALEEIMASSLELAVATLVGALRMKGADREAVAKALSKITGVIAADSEVVAWWEAWWRKNRGKPVEKWLLDSLASSGIVSEPNNRAKSAEELARYLENATLDADCWGAAWRLLRIWAFRRGFGAPPFPADSMEAIGALARALADRLMANAQARGQ